MTTQQQFQLTGWAEINSEGVAALYFASIDEAITTSSTDTPANTVFYPRILNPDQFSIRRAPVCWVHGQPGQNSGQAAAAFGQLEIDNYDGAFNTMLSADLRDTLVQIYTIPAKALMTGTEFHDNAFLVCTAIIDNIKSPKDDVIVITIKDTLSRLDKTIPVMLNPPWADEGAAGVMYPITKGACRNVQPLLVESTSKTFVISDQQIPNVAGVFDKAAQLDPNSNPPQYVPALGGLGIQLDQMPQGLLTCDVSSYGTQAVFPGATDILAGAGSFLGTWTGSPLVPPGFTWTNGAGSSIHEQFAASFPIFGSSNGVFMSSAKSWWASGDKGESLYTGNILKAGYTYRVTMGLYNVTVSSSPVLNGNVGGFALSIALNSTNQNDYITGLYGGLLNASGGILQKVAYEFTIPKGSDRPLCIVAIATPGSSAGSAVGVCTGTVFDLQIEQVGQFTALPLTAMPFDAYCTEVLVDAAGEQSTIFNSTEARALFTRADGTLIPFGVHYEQPPNILQMLEDPCETKGAVFFTDSTGTIRFRQLIDPSDPSNTIKADFLADGNVQRPIEIDSDDAQGLTTLFGARRNWKVFTNADFVTDQALVPQDEKTRYTRTSQFQVNSTLVPAAQYSFAISAPIFDTLFDLSSDAQDEADRINGIFAPRIYSNGTISNGKRRDVTFTAFYNDPSKVGIYTQTAVTDLQYGDIVSLNYPSPGNKAVGLLNVQAEILVWENFPFAHKLVLTVMV